MAVSTIKPPPFTQVIVLQFTAAVVTAALVGVIAGEDKGVIAYSTFLGGLISAIPGAYFDTAILCLLSASRYLA